MAKSAIKSTTTCVTGLLEMTEKEKFFVWFGKQRAKGLENFKVAVDHDAVRRNKPTEEEVYGELNRMHDAPDLHDLRFL